MLRQESVVHDPSAEPMTVQVRQLDMQMGIGGLLPSDAPIRINLPKPVSHAQVASSESPPHCCGHAVDALQNAMLGQFHSGHSPARQQ